MEKLKKDLKINSEKTIVWSKLTVIEKRKTLARDVIAQIKLSWINPSHGQYCELNPNIKYDNLQLELQQKNTCSPCVMGSLMASIIIRNNKFNNWWNSKEIEERLKGVFSKLQLRMMEAAFEGRIIDSVGNKLISMKLTTPLGQKCIDFCRKYKPPKTRVIKIMENIINDPKGLFLGGR